MTGIHNNHEPLPINFCTFGMFIIDEIEWTTPNSPDPKHNLIGGAGTYAVLGARLVAGRGLSKTISWIIDLGSDFPSSVMQTIESWDTTCVLRHDSSRKTTRAWNGYGPNEYRAFKYLTPKIRLEVSSLNHQQTLSNGFHMVCSPERCMSLVNSLLDARKSLGTMSSSPVIVWEPIPDLCSPAELKNLQKAAQGCTVISPNHDELNMFFEDGKDLAQDELVTRLMGWYSDNNAGECAARSPVVVVREGANGSTAYFPPIKSRFLSLHIGAYHSTFESHRVLDPTGGGNTYLGALTFSLAVSCTNHPMTNIIRDALSIDKLPPYTSNLIIAIIHANVAASFAIEQNGVPDLAQDQNSVNNVGIRELWNGESFEARLTHYLRREKDLIAIQIADMTPYLNKSNS